jgi:hypothetical protein
MFYTTDDLLTSVKVRTLAPTSQSTFTDANIVMLMNEELQLQLVPEILAIREDFFLTSKQVPLTAQVSNYRIPERAMGNALKEVFYVDGSGTRTQLTHTDIGIKATFLNTTGLPTYFYFEGDEISVVPTPGASTGNLEFWYFQRANQLVQTEDVTKITAINSVGGTTTFTVDTDLSSVITVASTKLDVLSAKSPFLLWAEDLTASAVTASSIAMATSGLVDAASTVLPQVGDYICLAQQANIPMIPQEFHPILAELVAGRLMEALGDTAKLQLIQGKLQAMRMSAMKMISNRVEQQPRTLINRNNLVTNSGWGRWSY